MAMGGLCVEKSWVKTVEPRGNANGADPVAATVFGGAEKSSEIRPSSQITSRGRTGAREETRPVSRWHEQDW